MKLSEHDLFLLLIGKLRRSGSEEANRLKRKSIQSHPKQGKSVPKVQRLTAQKEQGKAQSYGVRVKPSCSVASPAQSEPA